MRKISLAICLFLVSCLIGCGPTGPKTYPVSGTVTFDGKPVKVGDIIFIPLDRKLGPEAGTISDGKYTLRAKVGKCRVEITALDIGPNTKYMNGSPIAENFIPERYNLESELTAEVSPDADNAFNFELHSGGK